MADPLPLGDEAIRLAAVATFAESEGGPLIAMSERLIPEWLGVCDATGAPIFGTTPCDYDRACVANFGVIDVGAGRALALETPDNGTLVAQPDGALIVRWVGADDAATLLTAALAAADEDFEDRPDELVHDGGDLVLFDSASFGPELDRSDTPSVPLAAGTYGVRLLVEWSGTVLGSDGAPHDTMVQVVRLRRKA